MAPEKLVHSYLQSENNELPKNQDESYLEQENTVTVIQRKNIFNHSYLEPEIRELQLFRD